MRDRERGLVPGNETRDEMQRVRAQTGRSPTPVLQDGQGDLPFAFPGRRPRDQTTTERRSIGMAQAKADRKAAGVKAAATRKRNEARNSAETRGEKAAASRQLNDATKSARQARRAIDHAASDIASAAKSVGDAAVSVGKAAITRTGAKR